MTNQHPINPPPELVKKWWVEAQEGTDFDGLRCWVTHVATRAASWGADQELEACCGWLLINARFLDPGWIERLRTARRHKLSSLKEQALDRCNDYIDPDGIIRRALEALPDE